MRKPRPSNRPLAKDPYPQVAVYRCIRCGQNTIKVAAFNPPKKCDRCGGVYEETQPEEGAGQ